MLERIQAIYDESGWVLDTMLGYDINVELAIRYGKASLDDLEASENPTDEQVAEVFSALANLREKLFVGLGKVSMQDRPLIENLTDRIDIFLFHHRL